MLDLAKHAHIAPELTKLGSIPLNHQIISQRKRCQSVEGVDGLLATQRDFQEGGMTSLRDKLQKWHRARKFYAPTYRGKIYP